MQVRANDHQQNSLARLAIGTDGKRPIPGRSLSRGMLVSCITVVLSLTTMLSNRAHAQNASTKPNVTQETREKVERIRLKYPKFKLSPETQECLNGKVTDPECDPAINGEADVFLKRRANDERQQGLDERQRENTNMELAIKDVDVVLGLVQLGLFVFDDRTPPGSADYIKIAMENKSTSTEVKTLFGDYLGRKKRGEKFIGKADSERLVLLANKHLESANSLKAQISKNETFKKQISTLYSQAASSLEMAKQILAQKTGL